ncbi:hypothetical protein [Polaribacter sp.]|uniref:hypothetical protein n=1 Tax=Polaribacter sp. TaxID=1920175 RepID=UPI003F6CCE9E
MTKKDIQIVEDEVKRFNKRLKALKERLNTDGDYYLMGCKESGALKRSALDLKMELTRIT